MNYRRVVYLLKRNKIYSRHEKQKNGQNLKKDHLKEKQGVEENFQDLFNFYMNLISERAQREITKKEGKEVKQEIIERINVYMNPYKLKYLAKALLKITEKNDQDYLKFKSMITFFQQVHPEQLPSPYFRPQLLNDLHSFEEKLHNCELLHKNNHFTKNLSLANDTQLRSDEVPFLLIEKCEFFRDIDDKENKLQGMICGLANHRGGYIIACQSLTKNRITQGLKEISKEFIHKIKFKLETVLNTIVRKQDIGIEVQLKPLKQFNEKKTEEEYVILIQVKVNPQRSSNGFYIDRKKYNELYKLQLQNNQKQKLIRRYEKIIQEMNKKFPTFQFKKLSKEMNENNISSLKRLFCGQYENEWVCKKVNEYEEIQKIMKFNMKREASENLKWKQKFTSGITLNIKQIREKSAEKIQIKLHQNEDNRLRQICNYFMSRKQSKKEIAQFFSQISNQYSVGFIVRAQKMEMATINKIIQRILKKTKTPYNIVVPFLELQKQIGKFRKQQTNTFQYYCYYVSFKDKYQNFYKDFKQQLDKKKITSFQMKPIEGKTKVGSFLTSEDIKILSKTIQHFFNVKPNMKKKEDGKYPVTQEQYNIKVWESPFFKSELQKQPFKYKQIQIYFNENKLNASVFCYFLLQLSRKRPSRISN